MLRLISFLNNIMGVFWEGHMCCFAQVAGREAAKLLSVECPTKLPERRIAWKIVNVTLVAECRSVCGERAKFNAKESVLFCCMVRFMFFWHGQVR